MPVVASIELEKLLLPALGSLPIAEVDDQCVALISQQSVVLSQNNRCRLLDTLTVMAEMAMEEHTMVMAEMKMQRHMMGMLEMMKGEAITDDGMAEAITEAAAMTADPKNHLSQK